MPAYLHSPHRHGSGSVAVPYPDIECGAAVAALPVCRHNAKFDRQGEISRDAMLFFSVLPVLCVCC